MKNGSLYIDWLTSFKKLNERVLTEFEKIL